MSNIVNTNKSELDYALELFEFVDINDITSATLKKAFKEKALKVHPDKGGNAEEFDKMLAGFVYLTDIVHRVNGGRTTLQNIVTPDELKKLRPDELIERVFKEFEQKLFNAEFEKNNKQQLPGYDTWLSAKDEDTNVENGKYGEATQKPPTFDEKDLNTVFEETVKKGKPEPTAIILHPESMAYISGTVIGTAIIDTNEGGYTSAMNTTPEYTDVYSAFTSDNTICDKVGAFKENGKTLDDLIAERNAEITPFDDKEMKAIQEFEQKKLQRDINNISYIKEYFKNNESSSVSGFNFITSVPSELSPADEIKELCKDFIIDF
jgi:curved DNA-binding protein CbpA